jgi:hypothetical protein
MFQVIRFIMPVPARESVPVGAFYQAWAAVSDLFVISTAIYDADLDISLDFAFDFAPNSCFPPLPTWMRLHVFSECRRA